MICLSTPIKEKEYLHHKEDIGKCNWLTIRK